jgi:hypothetical protein
VVESDEGVTTVTDSACEREKEKEEERAGTLSPGCSVRTVHRSLIVLR